MPSEFLEFRSVLTPCDDPDPRSELVLAEYGAEAPPEVVELWEIDGLRGYDDGLIRTVYPPDFDHIVYAHFPEIANSVRTIMRDAFGYLYLYYIDSGAPIGISCSQGRVVRMNSKWVYFRLDLEDDEILDDIHHRGRYHEATRAIGTLESNECFAFTPALSIGGSGDLETLSIVDARVHFDFLLQLVRP
jgi:hypothetical protein